MAGNVALLSCKTVYSSYISCAKYSFGRHAQPSTRRHLGQNCPKMRSAGDEVERDAEWCQKVICVSLTRTAGTRILILISKLPKWHHTSALLVEIYKLVTLFCLKVFHAELERSVATLESADVKSPTQVILDPNEKSWVLENKLADINERYNR